jgi:type VI secretion system protein ImpL
VSDKVSGFVNSLVGLQGAISQVTQDPTAANTPGAFQPVIAAAISAHGAVSQTAQAFNIDPQAHIEQTVLGLLQAPIKSAEDISKPPPVSGGGLCASFSPLMAKFPFSPSSTTEASSAEIAAVFQPGSGSLWQFYDSALKPMVVQQGTTYIPALNAPQKVNPAFLQFFNKAANVSAALFPSGATSPGLTFTAHVLPSKGIQSVTFVVDAQRLSGSDVSKQFTWSAQTAQQAQLVANYGTGSFPLQITGPWALFHLISKGRVEQAGNPGRLAYPLEFSNTPIVVEGTPLVVHLELSGPGAGLLMPGGLSSLRCVSTVAH